MQVWVGLELPLLQPELRARTLESGLQPSGGQGPGPGEKLALGYGKRVVMQATSHVTSARVNPSWYFTWMIWFGGGGGTWMQAP